MAPPAHADDDRPWYAGTLVAGTGTEYSRGDYGDEEATKIWDVPMSVKYIFEEIGFTKWDEIEFKVSMPWRRIEEPNGAGDLRHREGFGDLSLRAGYFFVPESLSRPVVGGLVRVRLPTAQDGVGTDATDVSLALDVSQTIRFGRGRFPRITPFATASYRVSGSAPDYDRDDALDASLGFSLRAIEPLSVGVAYDFGASSSLDNERHEISPFASWRFGRNFRIGPYGVFGVGGSNAVDYAAGLSLRVSIDVE